MTGRDSAARGGGLKTCPVQVTWRRGRKWTGFLLNSDPV